MGKKKKKYKMKLNQDRVAGTERFPLGRGIYGRFLKNKQGLLELAVIVDDNVSQSDLRQAWTNIEIARQNLREIQGSNPGNESIRSLIQNFRLKILAKKNEGYSYAEIAMEINHDCLVNLCKVAILLEAGNQERAQFFIAIVNSHLIAMRMKTGEANEWIISGISEIQQGRAPWTLVRGPIDPQRVRDSIRQLKREMKNKQVIVKETKPPEMVKLKDLIGTVDKMATERANELLNKEPNSGGLERLRACLIKHLDSVIPVDALKPN